MFVSDPTRSPDLGLMGRAQAGKDTTATYLRTYGYRPVAFSAVLKSMALAVDPLVTANATDGARRLSDVVGRIGMDRAKVEFPEVRRFLQRLGTEGGRDHLGPNVWVDAALRSADAEPGPVVFTDVRYPNEVDAVRNRGGLLIWIDRPGSNPAAGHVSEESVSRELADVVISNAGTFADLQRQVDLVARIYGLTGA